MAGYPLRYARALFQSALTEGAEAPERYGALLEGFLKGLSSSPEMRFFLSGPHISKADKKRFLADLFADREDAVFLNFLRVLVDKDRLGIIDGIALDYRRLELDSSNTLEALIETAMPIGDDTVAAIKAAFIKKTRARGIIAKVLLVPELIGGVRVTVGGSVYDGSTRSELDRLGAKMKNRG